MGRSLGSGPTTHLATTFRVRGAIIQSGLLSAIRVVKNTGVTLPFDIFANIDKLHKVKSPTMIIHGIEDEVISVEHGYVRNFNLLLIETCHFNSKGILCRTIMD